MLSVRSFDRESVKPILREKEPDLLSRYELDEVVSPLVPDFWSLNVQNNF